MKSCCGDIVETAYCPSCGKKIGHDEHSLRQYLKTQTDNAESALNHARKYLNGDSTGYKTSQRQIDQSLKRFNKWNNWLNSLERLIKQQEGIK